MKLTRLNLSSEDSNISIEQQLNEKQKQKDLGIFKGILAMTKSNKNINGGNNNKDKDNNSSHKNNNNNIKGPKSSKHINIVCPSTPTKSPIQQKQPIKSYKNVIQQILQFKNKLPNTSKCINIQNEYKTLRIIKKNKTTIKSKRHIRTSIDTDLDMLQLNKHTKFQQQNNNILLINKQKDQQPPLIDCLALYGLSQFSQLQQKQFSSQNSFSSQKHQPSPLQQLYLPQLLYCSSQPHQIINHSTKLIYPNKIYKNEIMKYNNNEIQKVISLLNYNIKKAENKEFKVFTLIFEPAEVYIPNSGKEVGWKDNSIEIECQQNKICDHQSEWQSYNAVTITNSINSNQYNNNSNNNNNNNNNNNKQKNHYNKNNCSNTPIYPIQLVNPQKRYYAFCIQYNDFDLIQNQEFNSLMNQIKDNMSFQNTIDRRIYEEDIKQIKKDKENNKNKNKQKKNHENDKQQKLILQIQTQTHPHIRTSRKSATTPPFSSTTNTLQNSLYSIRMSKKVLTIFSKYPFIQFFQHLLTKILKQSFYHRLQQISYNINKLKNYDFNKQIDYIKNYYQSLNNKFNLQQNFNKHIGEKYQINIVEEINKKDYIKIQLNLSYNQLKMCYAGEWAYSVLALFSLDKFLDVFTLIMLEEKTIFVCENPTILTHAILLFTKILMAPFTYPYPCVSIIPNQYDYFNAPFPIVYGCLNDSQKLIKQKVTKTYKNVYVFMKPNGVEIHCQKSLTKVLNRKSARLRDKLLPEFMKIQKFKQQQIKRNSNKKLSNIGMSFISWFINNNNNTNSTNTPIPIRPSSKNSLSKSSQSQRFSFSPTHPQISCNIILKITKFLSQIKSKFPSRSQILQIKRKLQKQIIQSRTKLPQKQVLDLQKQVYEKCKMIMLEKTKDPFVQKFLDTQIVAIEILK